MSEHPKALCGINRKLIRLSGDRAVPVARSVALAPTHCKVIMFSFVQRAIP